MSAHGSGALAGFSGGFRGGHTKYAPIDIRTKVFTEDGLPSGLGLSLDGWASLGGHLPFPPQPFTDGGLLDPESESHCGLAPEALDRALDCIHDDKYRHCRCVPQAHCLLQAVPVEIGAMHTGPKLGEALKDAMLIKGVKQAAVAQAFGVRQPSVSEWLKYGRIGKKHIPRLVEWFSDVVGPEHWGLPAAWSGSASANADGDQPSMSQSDAALLRDVKLVLPADELQRIQGEADRIRRVTAEQQVGPIRLAHSSDTAADDKRGAPKTRQPVRRITIVGPNLSGAGSKRKKGVA